MQRPEQHLLPKKRRISITEWVDNKSFGEILLIGIGLYLFVILLFTFFECLIGFEGKIVINNNANNVSLSYLDVFYFNAVSVLTIGYGELTPIGVFRWIVLIETITGLAIYGVLISIVTIKILVPKKDVIIFSKYAYYCVDDNAFMVIYLNTATRNITNLETSWYFKLNEDWETKVPGKVPFITKSVQTFYLKNDDLNFDLIQKKLHRYDCLRIGLTGNLGMANYSTSIQYNLEEILVLDNRNVLTAYEGFYRVDENLCDDKFKKMFHYSPDMLKSLYDFLPK